MASKYGNIQSPFDPYSGVQTSFIRYSGYRSHQFHINEIQRRKTLAELKAGAKFVGSLCLVGIGFYVLNLLSLG